MCKQVPRPFPKPAIVATEKLLDDTDPIQMAAKIKGLTWTVGAIILLLLAESSVLLYFGIVLAGMQ
jgi:hypothetical protein